MVPSPIDPTCLPIEQAPSFGVVLVIVDILPPGYSSQQEFLLRRALLFQSVCCRFIEGLSRLHPRILMTRAVALCS